MSVLTSAQRDLLIRMLQAERQQQRCGQRDTFVLVRTARGGGILTAGWDENWAAPGEQDVDDLVEDGLLRHVDHPGGRGRKFDFTRAGRTRARQLERDRTDPSRLEPIDLSWTTTLALLEALVDAYELVGAPEYGVPLTALNVSPPPTQGELRELARQELAEFVDRSDQAESQLRPTAQGVRLARNWPTPGALVDALAVAFEREAEITPDGEARSRLRQAAQAVGDFGRDVAVGVVTKQLEGL